MLYTATFVLICAIAVVLWLAGKRDDPIPDFPKRWRRLPYGRRRRPYRRRRG